MTEFHSFFHGADNYLGVFYPNGYLIAMFPDLTAAMRLPKTFDFQDCFSRTK